MSPAEKFIPYIDKLRKAGSGRWSARCPAHADKGPSLAVRELDDGRLLVHCFAGCNVEEVVGAVGLTMEDLFPPRDTARGAGHSRERRPFSAMDLIDIAAWEASVASLIAIDILNGRAADIDRLLMAAGNLSNVAEAAHAR